MRLPSTFRLRRGCPGRTNTAGRSARRRAAAARARDGARARVPLASSPAHDSGPIAAKSGGRVARAARSTIACDRALVGEVVEVRDLAALVEQEASRCRRARGRAAVHRARLHDEVVVGPVEGVGEQRLHPRADRVALACRRRSTRSSPAIGVGRPRAASARAGCRASAPRGPAARPARRAAARPRRGSRPAPATTGMLGELERPLEDRQVGVEPLRREQRAARRAGDAHDALDADALRLRRARRARAARSRCAAYSSPANSAKSSSGLARRRAPAPRRPGRRANASRDAARAPAGSASRERQRVGDRADAERRVVERVDAVAVAASNSWRTRSRCAASTACRTCRGVGERAVDEAPAAARRRRPRARVELARRCPSAARARRRCSW